MYNLTDNDKREIDEFIEDNMRDIAYDLAKVYDFDSERNSYIYSHFCEDGEFSWISYDPAEGHLCEIDARGTVTDGDMITLSDGSWPNDETYEIRFVFLIDKNGNGEYTYSFYTDSEGNIDHDRTFYTIFPDDYCDY